MQRVGVPGSCHCNGLWITVTLKGVLATPCNVSFHQSYAGMPSLGIAGAVLSICFTFSSSVSRLTKSLTLLSMDSAVFHIGYDLYSCAWTRQAQNRHTAQSSCFINYFPVVNDDVQSPASISFKFLFKEGYAGHCIFLKSLFINFYPDTWFIRYNQKSFFNKGLVILHDFFPFCLCIA